MSLLLHGTTPESIAKAQSRRAPTLREVDYHLPFC